MATTDPANLIQRLQGQVENATDRVVKTFDEHFTKLVPHGILDEKVPPDEELMEYIALAQDPDPVKASHGWIDARAGQYGAPVATTMYTKWVIRNQERVDKLVREREGGEDVGPLP